MHPDARRWNARYRERGPRARFDPEPRLVAQRPRLPAPRRALDLACGTGANAMWLQASGWQALGLDVSIEALRIAAAEARRRDLATRWLASDALAPPFPAATFDLVVVTRFLDRRAWPVLASLLAPGGHLFYCTFNVRHLQRRPGFNRDFVLEPGELDAAFSMLRKIDGNDAKAPSGDEGDTSTWLLARRDHD